MDTVTEDHTALRLRRFYRAPIAAV